MFVVASVRSANDARKIQAVLDSAGIPSCLGPDNIDDIESFRGTFDRPVSLKVYSPFAGRASTLIERLRKSIPPEFEYDVQGEDDEENETDDDIEESGPRCPKCHSEEVVFDNLESDAWETGRAVAGESAKYKWHCDACGYQWQDDGFEENT